MDAALSPNCFMKHFGISLVTILVLLLSFNGVQAQTDPGYRVVFEPPNRISPFPPSSQPWELQYKFVVPPLPHSKTWVPKNSEIYIWGDVDFDQYGSSGKAPISNYRFNQIVPQLMVGDVFAAHNSDYSPVIKTYEAWVIEAQYYWRSKDGKDYDFAGPAVGVSPGEIVTTTISYDPQSGIISTEISTPRASSKLDIPRPFPNESLFSNWREFFKAAEERSQSPVVGQAVINVESHNTDIEAVRSLLPFQILQMKGPGFPKLSSEFRTRAEGGLTCNGDMVKLGF